MALVVVKWYVSAKDNAALLIQANEGIEIARWLVRMASDRKRAATPPGRKARRGLVF
jgi:hypothetical protein